MRFLRLIRIPAVVGALLGAALATGVADGAANSGFATHERAGFASGASGHDAVVPTAAAATAPAGIKADSRRQGSAAQSHGGVAALCTRAAIGALSSTRARTASESAPAASRDEVCGYFATAPPGHSLRA